MLPALAINRSTTFPIRLLPPAKVTSGEPAPRPKSGRKGGQGRPAKTASARPVKRNVTAPVKADQVPLLMVPIESAVGPAAVEYPYAHNGFPPQQRQFSAFTPPSAAGPHSHEPPERVHSSAQIPLAMGKAGGPRKRAVVVGCCYPRNVDIRLNGCANDAQVFALSLVHLLQFAPHNVVLLTDVYPNSCYRSKPRHRPHEMELAPDLQDDPLRLPTRQNILLGLNWLRSNAAAGDALVFFFAGHGIQVLRTGHRTGRGTAPHRYC
eukprot:Polyplicarium_translucidae@DN2280_c0_g1_i3.p1